MRDYHKLQWNCKRKKILSFYSTAAVVSCWVRRCRYKIRCTINSDSWSAWDVRWHIECWLRDRSKLDDEQCRIRCCKTAINEYELRGQHSNTRSSGHNQWESWLQTTVYGHTDNLMQLQPTCTL